MQHLMRERPLEPAAVDRLLARAMVGRISTVGADGYPYTVAVHFLYREGAVYFHGLPQGEKIANLTREPKVCFEVDEMGELHLDGVTAPCKVGTAYESVVIRGKAALVSDPAQKEEILRGITEKYAPALREAPIPPEMISGTAVVRIAVDSRTGKYHN